MNGFLHGLEEIFIICVETPEEHTHTLFSRCFIVSSLKNQNYSVISVMYSVYFISHYNPECVLCVKSE